MNVSTAGKSPKEYGFVTGYFQVKVNSVEDEVYAKFVALFGGFVKSADINPLPEAPVGPGGPVLPADVARLMPLTNKLFVSFAVKSTLPLHVDEPMEMPRGITIFLLKSDFMVETKLL